jgi:hypothetical protein
MLQELLDQRHARTKVDIKQLVIKVTADVTASTTLDADTIIIYSVYLPNFKI